MPKDKSGEKPVSVAALCAPLQFFCCL